MYSLDTISVDMVLVVIESDHDLSTNLYILTGSCP
jgi:hypothetical protein